MLTPTIRLAAQLNVLASQAWSAEGAAHTIVGADAAHHVVDPEGVLGIDPLYATPLEEALPELARREPIGWVLALPRPGRLAPLRGPAGFNQAALAAGAAAIGWSGTALIGQQVGRAVQWRVHAAARPRPELTAYEAERLLDSQIRAAARALDALDVAGGERPPDDPLVLPAGYQPRRRAAADKAYRLLLACDAALDDHGGALSSFEMEARTRAVRAVRQAASDALCAAISALDTGVVDPAERVYDLPPRTTW